MLQLDEWARALQARIDPSWNSLQRLARLRTFMYEELGFKGDVQGYYSPVNSLLHSVMQRRLGIPLTLSIVFMEIGWRIGVPFEGVGFPGHFLVRLAGEPADLLLDPYDHAASVHEDDCRRMIQMTTGGTVPFDPNMVRSMSKKDMIARLLFNLKVACLKANDDLGALSAVERLLLLHPNDAPELRDRGLLLYRLDRYRDARSMLEAYLRARPDALDREVIERHMAAIEMMVAKPPRE
jgi:regulator of sirC expression with transglutaminase-like and TPR domain